MENRNGLSVDGRVSEASGTAARDEAEAMVADLPGRHKITVGSDWNFDTAGFVAAMRGLGATPHVAQSTTNRRSAINRRTTRHPGYAVSRRVRKRIEAGFGWTRRWPCSGAPGIATKRGSAGSSPSAPRPTT